MASPGRLARVGSYALYPLRVGLAIVFLAHGLDKLTAFGPWSAYVASIGFPLADGFAGLVIAVEVLGSIGLLAGTFTRTSATALSCVIVVAIVTVRIPGPIVGNLDLDLAVLGGLLTLVINGAGRPTVSSVLAREATDPEDALLDRMLGWAQDDVAGPPDPIVDQ